MEGSLHSEWDRVPDNPDLKDDLGYEISDLEVIKTDEGPGHLLFLPWDRDMIEEEAYIVTDSGAVVELLDVR